MGGSKGIGVAALILNKDHEVLLGKREDGAGWSLPGGKVEYGESFEETVIRETLEECGITIQKLSFISLSNELLEQKNAQFATVGFFVEAYAGTPAVTEPEEITEWQWFSLNNLPEHIFFCSQNVLSNFMQKVPYRPGIQRG